MGDGDAKSWSEVTKQNFYGDDHPVEKMDCVGHVQKRMGNRLLKWKKKATTFLLEDLKGVDGQGRLTDDVIDRYRL